MLTLRKSCGSPLLAWRGGHRPPVPVGFYAAFSHHPSSARPTIIVVEFDSAHDWHRSVDSLPMVGCHLRPRLDVWSDALCGHLVVPNAGNLSGSGTGSNHLSWRKCLHESIEMQCFSDLGNSFLTGADISQPQPPKITFGAAGWFPGFRLRERASNPL